MRRLLLPLLVACASEDDPAPTTPDAPWRQETRAPFLAPDDPLEGTTTQSCAVLDATRCHAGEAQVCAPYDPAAERFVDDLDPLALRALRYDRWYDLFHSPDGQAAEREFTTGIAAGTPEEEWADPSVFSRYDGVGDAAIWTGVAANAALLRWLSTGTTADRDRYEALIRTLLTLFEVTGVDGYLARHHYLVTDDASTRGDAHIFRTAPNSGNLPASLDGPDLPASYLDGTSGEPWWHGNPSIDQYTGPMVTFPAAWSLLDDPDLRDRLARQLTCYLTRLRKIELRNLQSSELAAGAIAEVFAFDPGLQDDPDAGFAELDTLHAWVLPRLHAGNAATYDTTCPDEVQLEPWRILDAASSDFATDLLALIADAGAATRNSIDHFYIPNVRGGDAMHMLHLTASAWHMTGDERWRDAFHDVFVDAMDAPRVANTLGSLQPPPWCRSFYGDHITIWPLWAALNLLDDSPVRDELVRAMREQAWGQLAEPLLNAKFMLLAAHHVPDLDHLAADAVSLLDGLHGNGGVLDDPRRTYALPYEDPIDAGATPRCPTEAERAQCEDGFSFGGTRIGGESIGHTCFGVDAECPLGDGRCAWALASEALPPELRPWDDFIWQRSPFKLGRLVGDGRKQSPGLDLTEPFWLARYLGATDAGAGVVLAWRGDGSCAEPE